VFAPFLSFIFFLFPATFRLLFFSPPKGPFISSYENGRTVSKHLKRIFTVVTLSAPVVQSLWNTVNLPKTIATTEIKSAVFLQAANKHQRTCRKDWTICLQFQRLRLASEMTRCVSSVRLLLSFIYLLVLRTVLLTIWAQRTSFNTRKCIYIIIF